MKTFVVLLICLFSLSVIKAQDIDPKDQIIKAQSEYIKTLETLVLIKNIKKTGGEVVNLVPIEIDSLSKLELVDELLPEKNLHKSLDSLIIAFWERTEQSFPYKQNALGCGGFFHPKMKLFYQTKDNNLLAVVLEKESIHDNTTTIKIYKVKKEDYWLIDNGSANPALPGIEIKITEEKKGINIEKTVSFTEEESKKAIVYATTLNIIGY